MRWRVVGTDSEGLDGVTQVCDARDPSDASSPAHNSLDMMDCCAASLVLRIVPSEHYQYERKAQQLADALTALDIDQLEVCD